MTSDSKDKDDNRREFDLLLEKTNQLHRTVRTGIWVICIILVTWIITNALVKIASSITWWQQILIIVAASILPVVTNVIQEYRIRKFTRDNIQRKNELEIEYDPSRKSSKLNTDGTTRKEDA